MFVYLNITFFQATGASRCTATMLCDVHTKVCDNPSTILDYYLTQEHKHKHVLSKKTMKGHSSYWYRNYVHTLRPAVNSYHYADAAPGSPLWCERCLCWKTQRRCTVLPAAAPHWARDLHTLTLAGEEGATAASYCSA
jgi:hypothetical protein